MKPRLHRILACLAAHPAGLTALAITALTDPEKPGKVKANRTALSTLKNRQCIARASRGIWVITDAGSDELELREGGYSPRLGRPKTLAEMQRHVGRHLGPDLSDTPVVHRTTAINGQAPRGLISSPFAMGMNHV